MKSSYDQMFQRQQLLVQEPKLLQYLTITINLMLALQLTFFAWIMSEVDEDLDAGQQGLHQ